MKIVVASDSFKGSLTSAQVAEAVAEGIKTVDRQCETVGIEVADGGEGTAEALTRALNGERVTCVVNDPLCRRIRATYGIVTHDHVMTAVIDVASACGLTLLSSDTRNPAAATSRGVGEMIEDAYLRGCRRFMIGLGGSATCDGGAGMLSALGVRLFDSKGDELPDGGAALSDLAVMDAAGACEDIFSCDFTVMSDVTNPLCGENGAAIVFSPQKGATPEMARELDKALCRYAAVLEETTGRNVADLPGAGAAGGLGAAFLAFFRSTLKSGVDVVLDTVEFDKAIDGADLVITGEGRIDRQTLCGKLPMGVCRRAMMRGVPCVAIAGEADDAGALLQAGFAGVFSIQSGVTTIEEAMLPAVARENVRTTAASVVKLFGCR